MDSRFLRGLARAFGGALVFSLPLFMTMEMWALGTTIPSSRLLILLTATIPLLVGLSHFIGFEPTFGVIEDSVDAMIAFGVGCTTSALILWLFGVIDSTSSVHSALGRILLQSVPGSIGALLAQSEFGTQSEREKRRADAHGYGGVLFIMATGALFLCLNIAPTEEITLIAGMMTKPRAITLVLLSVIIMHAFVYVVEFRGGARGRESTGLKPFLLLTVPGYAVSITLSAGILWTFGRLDGLSAGVATQLCAVLGFPAALGAASARLLLWGPSAKH